MFCQESIMKEKNQLIQLWKVVHALPSLGHPVNISAWGGECTESLMHHRSRCIPKTIVRLFLMIRRLSSILFQGHGSEYLPNCYIGVPWCVKKSPLRNGRHPWWWGRCQLRNSELAAQNLSVWVSLHFLRLSADAVFNAVSRELVPLIHH